MNINLHISVDESIIHINSQPLTYVLCIDPNTFGGNLNRYFQRNWQYKHVLRIDLNLFDFIENNAFYKSEVVTEVLTERRH